MIQETCSSWISGLNTRFAGYRDVLQPLLLAGYELKHGIALAAAAVKAAASPPPTALRQPLLALLSCPQTINAVEILSAASDEMVATFAVAVQPATASAADALLASEMETEERGVTYSSLHDSPEYLRVDLLRIALHTCGGAVAHRGTPLAASWSAMRQLFSRAVDLWAEARAAVVDAEKEALSEFRNATRSLAAAAAEVANADEEVSYRARFEKSPFADMEAAGEELDVMASDEAAAADAAAAAAAAAASSAAESRTASKAPALSVALREDLLSVHWDLTTEAGFDMSDLGWRSTVATLNCPPHGADVWMAIKAAGVDWLNDSDSHRCARLASRLALGSRMLRSSGGARGDVIGDGDCLGAAAMTLALEHLRLSTSGTRGTRIHPRIPQRRMCRCAAAAAAP